MAEKKYYNHVYQTYRALGDILIRYQWIQIKDIQYFAPVYYPIAMIEMDFDEKTFEDFEEIQLIVLKLVSIGITDPEIISETLGMHNPGYILKVLNLLKGYGHINESGITELGIESLEEEKKILFSRVKQKFQMDALNGSLLRLEQNLIDSSLSSGSSTNLYVAHLSPIDGISSETVRRMISDKGLDYYKKYRSSILNTNLEDIHDMSCTDIQYAGCYLMKFMKEETPVVFAKRYDVTAETEEERFAFKPLSYDSESEYFLQQFHGQDIPHNTPETSFALKKLLWLMGQKIAQANIAEITSVCLRKWNAKVSIPTIRVQLNSLESSRFVILKLDCNDFKEYSGSLLFFLDAVNLYGEFLITSPDLCGRLISLRTEDALILDTASAYGEVKKYLKPSKIAKNVYESYDFENGSDAIQGKKLFEILLNHFQKMLKKIQ